MTIADSSTLIHCQRCGTGWDKTSGEKMREFTSESYPRSTYASPAQIVAASELMTRCPSCFDRQKDRALGDFSLYLKREDTRVDPDHLDRERPQRSGTSPDVTHQPEPDRGA